MLSSYICNWLARVIAVLEIKAMESHTQSGKSILSDGFGGLRERVAEDTNWPDKRESGCSTEQRGSSARPGWRVRVGVDTLAWVTNDTGQRDRRMEHFKEILSTKTRDQVTKSWGFRKHWPKQGLRITLARCFYLLLIYLLLLLLMTFVKNYPIYLSFLVVLLGKFSSFFNHTETCRDFLFGVAISHLTTSLGALASSNGWKWASWRILAVVIRDAEDTPHVSARN